MTDSNYAWNTSDELKFLARISEREDKTALRGYAQSVSKRADWASIDKRQIAREITKQMRGLK